MKIGIGIGLMYQNGTGDTQVAPVNTVAPVISGSTSLGSTLSCTTGTWTGTPNTFTYSYQWKRNGSNIGGATSSTYVTVVADSTANITCVVTATNGVSPDGTATSNTLTMANYTPANTVAPAITGSTSLGSTLTCSTGTWTNSPTSYSYQWKRNGSNIGGATSSTYVTTTSDSSASITCDVTANNGLASSPATSNTVSLPNYTPANTVAPSVTGTAVVGQTLTTTNGTWTNSPTSYTYQWYRGATLITGATSSSYTLVQADAGNASNIKCTVTASNGLTASADSNTVAQVLTVRTNSFLTATSITDSTIKGALNTFDIGLIINSLDTKMKALYPFVGGTSSTHKWNFMDARDLDAAYRLVFFGTLTHDSNGVQGNGVNGYADTKVNSLNDLKQNSNHFSFYSRTLSTATTSVEMGVSNATNTFIHLRVGVNYLAGGLNFTNFTTTSTAAKFWVGTRTASNLKTAYYNGLSEGTNTTNDVVPYLNSNVYLLARNDNNTAAVFSDKQCAFASIGDGLSSTDVNNLNTLVTNLQTALGRNV